MSCSIPNFKPTKNETKDRYLKKSSHSLMPSLNKHLSHVYHVQGIADTELRTLGPSFSRSSWDTRATVKTGSPRPRGTFVQTVPKGTWFGHWRKSSRTSGSLHPFYRIISAQLNRVAPETALKEKPCYHKGIFRGSYLYTEILRKVSQETNV